MVITLQNPFHNTKVNIRYTGGEQPLSRRQLRALCPFRDCSCLGSPAGAPRPLYREDPVRVEWDVDKGWTILPEEA